MAALRNDKGNVYYDNKIKTLDDTIQTLNTDKINLKYQIDKLDF